jgi:hypothetical protein|tara:strand:+ start:1908 stop:2093 length:186 start_codon:yes stop_codon:yes gene_type:complete
MIKSKNGDYLTEYSVVIDPYGRLYCVDSFEESGKVKCRNGCVFIYWNPEDLTTVDYREDIE